MSNFYHDTPGSSSEATYVRSTQTQADDAQRARWDGDASFWRIDTWTEAELADEARFGHYMANQHVHKRSR